ncbi:MAG: arginase family protein [Candidatus Saccharibacteria bacterium]
MKGLEPYNNGGFLDAQSGYKEAKAVILPFGFSASPAGKRGPEEIIEASKSLETFDDELFDDIPSRIPVWTAGQPELSAASENAVSALGSFCDGLAKDKKLPLVIGGDHTITSGAISGLVQRFRDVSLVIFDSHLDFIDPKEQKLNRNNWLGRALPYAQNAVVLGARSYNKAEWDFWKSNMSRLIVYEAGTEGAWNLRSAMDFLADYVYVSFDLDVLDPSIMPATENPEPEGLDFRQALNALRTILSFRNVIGIDVCNYVPIPGFRTPALVAAMLIKKMILYAFKGKELAGK